MIRFRDLRVRTKLAIVFTAMLVPLLAAEVVAILAFRDGLRDSAELELRNIVDHLQRLCAAQRQRAIEAGAAGDAPRAEDVAFLREAVLSFRVGRTGYAYVMDPRGRLLVHPSQEGRTILDSRDADGFAFIREIVERAPRLGPGESGTIRYPWRNPEAGETEPRMKILKYRWFAPWGWVLAAGSYEEEVYQAVGRVERTVLPLAAASLVLVVVLTLAMGRLITRPLRQLSRAAARMAADERGQRVEPRSGDEFGELTRAFNLMADQVRAKTENLGRLVDERTEELRASREMYRSLVESTVDGIVTTDSRGVITFANRGLEQMMGYGRDEMIGREIWRYYEGGKEQARRIMRLLREAGGVTNLEMTLLGREHRIPIRTSASVLRDVEARERGTLGIFSDVSAEKRLEADLRSAQAHLVQTMKLRALGDLVSGVAHEINNPLMASTAMLHVMVEQAAAADPLQRRRIEVLRRCNDRVAKIVDHLREFSRQSEIDLRPLSIARPLENALLISGQQLLNLQVEIQREIAPDLPEILGDANYLEQVFLDLFANARDAMEGCSEKTLEIRAESAVLDGRPAVAVTIVDSGPGIPDSVRDKIFEPFFTTKEVGKGTGLGLAIAYGIIEQHGGRIEVDNEPGRGARFRIIIPAREPGAGPGSGEGRS